MPNPTRTVNGETREWNGNSWVPVNAPAGPQMHHPGLSESPTDAALAEGMRTAGQAAKGLAESPWSAVKALVGLPATAVRGLTEIPQGVEALMDPATYRGAVPAAKQAVTDLGNDPEAAGNLLGQLVLGETMGPKLPGMAQTALEKGPGVIGRGIAKTGRGLEAAGNSRLGRVAEYGGLGDLVYRGDPKGALIAGAPTAAKLAGKGLQSLGGSIEGLKLAAKAPVEAPPSVVNGLTLSKDALGRNIEATNMVDDGFSPTQAGKLSGIPGAGESKLISRVSHLPQIPEMSVQDVLDNMALPQKDWAISPAEDEGVSLARLKAAGGSDAPTPYSDWRAPVKEAPAPPYDVLKEVNPAAVEAGYAQNNPIFKQLQAQGLFDGNRNTPSPERLDSVNGGAAPTPTSSSAWPPLGNLSDAVDAAGGSIDDYLHNEGAARTGWPFSSLDDLKKLLTP